MKIETDKISHLTLTNLVNYLGSEKNQSLSRDEFENLEDGVIYPKAMITDFKSEMLPMGEYGLCPSYWVTIEFVNGDYCVDSDMAKDICDIILK